MRLTGKQRLRFVRYYLRVGGSVTGLCREYGISRPTFYLWLGRYKKSGRAGLVNRHCSGRRHWNATPVLVERKVLELVGLHPKLSSKRISRLLGKDKAGNVILGNHGVQNIFCRYNLNTRGKRIKFSKKDAGKRVVESSKPFTRLFMRVLRLFPLEIGGPGK